MVTTKKLNSHIIHFQFISYQLFLWSPVMGVDVGISLQVVVGRY